MEAEQLCRKGRGGRAASRARSGSAAACVLGPKPPWLAACGLAWQRRGLMLQLVDFSLEHFNKIIFIVEPGAQLSGDLVFDFSQFRLQRDDALQRMNTLLHDTEQAVVFRHVMEIRRGMRLWIGGRRDIRRAMRIVVCSVQE